MLLPSDGPGSERASDAEAMRQIAHAGVVAVTAAGAQIARIVLPGAAAEHVLAAALALPGRTIARRAVLVLVPAIGDPLRHIAAHVVKPEGIGGKAADLDGMTRIVRLAAAATVGDAGLHLISPPVFRLRAAACRVFPFGLRRQTVGCAGHAREPRGILLRIGPAHIGHRRIVVT